MSSVKIYKLGLQVLALCQIKLEGIGRNLFGVEKVTYQRNPIYSGTNSSSCASTP